MKPAFACQVAKVVGTPTDGFWSQVHTFFPEDTEKKEIRGDLLAVLILTGVPEGIESVAAGREVLGRLHEEYYGNLQSSAYDRLKKTVEKIAKENEGLEILAAVILGNVLYLVSFGHGRVFLKRGEKSGILLTGNGDLVTASGFLQSGDLLVIGSHHFFQVVGDGILKASLESGSVADAVEMLAPIVLGRKDMASAAAVLALVQEEKELEIPAMVNTSPGPELAIHLPRTTILSKLKTKFTFFSLSTKPIFLKTPAVERRKKIFFAISIVLLVLLGLSLVMGRKRLVVEKQRSQAKAILKQAEEKLNQGKVLSTTNPTQSKVLAEEAITLTSQAISLSGENTEEGVFLKDQIGKFIASLGQEVALAEPTTFMDLTLIADGARGDGFALSGKDLVILDQAKKKIYFLNTEKKSNKIVSCSGGNPKYIGSYDSKIFVFDDKGVYVASGQTSPALKINKDEDWKNITGIASYLGHVYLLDSEGNVIWRYLASGDGFGPKKNWFSGTAPDLSNSVSLAIDSAVWVLDKEGISKYNLGKKENFVLSKMPENFVDPVKLYTSSLSNNLYVLDKGSGKIFVIGKDGTFQSVYAWEGFKQATDLVALESAKKIFVLSGSKIYEVRLR